MGTSRRGSGSDIFAENPSFYDYLTAEELLEYFAQLFGYPQPQRRQRVSDLLDRVGIGRERRFQLRKLSKGTVQRFGIAQALMNDPEILFLDEPMSGLDPLGRRDVRALILELRTQGRTVFFSSHILSDAEALCGRVAVLAGGRLVAQGRLAELQEFSVKGWELVVANVTGQALERVRPRAVRSRRSVPTDSASSFRLIRSPDTVLTELVASGASVVSLNPLRETLEDFFVERVTRAGRDARH